jgi:diketogulonate reductase-like aldo/keto reductase
LPRLVLSTAEPPFLLGRSSCREWFVSFEPALQQTNSEAMNGIRATGILLKQLANTGVALPEIALGTWHYRGGAEPLRVGIELGANFIDTAESYGTEEVVGKAVQGIRDKVFIATKALPRHFRRADIIRAAEQSLKRLNTDYIDLYQLHWPNYSVPIGETMAGMEELVEAGKIRFIGLSNFSAREIEQAQRHLSKNRIASNQVRYSLVDRTIEDGLLQHCESMQITVLAFSPLDSGLQNLREFDQRDVLGQVARETGRTRAQVALNWCLCRGAVIAIFKTDSVEHVQENCGASGWRLDPKHLEALNRVGFRHRGRMGRFGRRIARDVLQRLGRNI